jgi:two-component system chemotaxis response regulator CheY
MKAKTVLVIDDSEPIRTQVGHALRGAGYEVLEAADGLMGAFAIREHAADICLVVCDINMPRLDGLEMLEVLRGQFPSLPVLMLTTESRVDKVDRAKKAGAKGWMIKPFKPEHLVEAVNKLTTVAKSPVRRSNPTRAASLIPRSEDVRDGRPPPQKRTR